MQRQKKQQARDPISQQGKWWVYWADWDWVSARVLYLKKNPKLWTSAGLLGHKALEQYLKAFLRSHGDKTEWKGTKGHILVNLAESCAAHDPYFSNPVVVHRIGVFFDVYRAWRYPQNIREVKLSGEVVLKDVSPEVAVMGGNNLVVLDETIAEIRPRIRLAELGLLPTFEELHKVLPEGPQFVHWAREENHKFSLMEELSKQRNPNPTLEQIQRSVTQSA